MKIAKIEIQNILGIEEFSYEAGKFNEITGDNGTGKTSIQEAIKSALKGGHDATLLRKGAKEGSVVLIFDTGEYLTKTVTEDKSKIDVTGTTRPAEYLNKIRELTSINPISLLNATPKDRMEILLNAMPFEFDYEAFSKLVGLNVIPTNNPLNAIAYWRKKYYDDRTGVNRSATDKAKSIRDLEMTLPHEELPSIEDSTLDAELKELQRLTRVSYDKAEQNFKDKSKELTDKYNADMAALNASHSKEKEEITASYNNDAKPIEEKIIVVREAEKNRAVITKTREMIAHSKAEEQALKEESESYTKVIEQIDSLKENLLKNIPIAGLELIDGEIYIDGIEWDRVNEARRMQVAIQIVTPLSGDLKLMCVDGMEALSETAFEAFKAEALKSDMQYFVSRVADTPLTVSQSN